MKRLYAFRADASSFARRLQGMFMKTAEKEEAQGFVAKKETVIFLKREMFEKALAQDNPS